MRAQLGRVPEYLEDAVSTDNGARLVVDAVPKMMSLQVVVNAAVEGGVSEHIVPVIGTVPPETELTRPDSRSLPPGPAGAGLVDDGDSETLVMTVQPVQGLPDPGTFGHGGLVSVGEPLDAHRPGSGDDVGCPVGQTISAAAGADPCDGTLTHFPVDLVHHAPPVGQAL